jgi:hypothetical protein
LPAAHRASDTVENSRASSSPCAPCLDRSSIRFTFNTAAWITNAPSDVNGNLVDISAPRLLVEEIMLTPEERLYYQTTKLQFEVPRVWSRGGSTVSGMV